VRRYPHGYLSGRWAAHASDRFGIWSPPAGFAPGKGALRNPSRVKLNGREQFNPCNGRRRAWTARHA
jgi:hypothetical protein